MSCMVFIALLIAFTGILIVKLTRIKLSLFHEIEIRFRTELESWQKGGKKFGRGGKLRDISTEAFTIYPRARTRWYSADILKRFTSTDPEDTHFREGVNTAIMKSSRRLSV